MTPAQVLDKIIAYLVMDEGPMAPQKFIHPAHRIVAEPVIAAMQAAGWNPEGLTAGLCDEYDYEDDMAVIGSGEYSDQRLIMGKYLPQGSKYLYNVVADIFDPEGEPDDH